jgi:hypothetical protein
MRRWLGAHAKERALEVKENVAVDDHPDRQFLIERGRSVWEQCRPSSSRTQEGSTTAAIRGACSSPDTAASMFSA